MKKALILALTVLTVLCMATAALAVEVSYEGLVEVKWAGETDVDPGFDTGDVEATVNIDFKKDFGDGVTAGLKTRLRAHETGIMEFKDDGWIQLERDLFTAKASTDIDGNAAKDLGGEWDLTGAPGLGLDLNLIEGLTINSVINAGPNYGYVVKGGFEQDLFTVGGGYQAEKVDILDPLGAVLYADVTKSALAAYGTFNVIEPLTIGAEYGMRKLSSKELDADLEALKEDNFVTAILANAAYKDDAIDASASFLMSDEGFVYLDYADDGDEFLARDTVRGISDNNYMVIFTDASYKVTDAIGVNGAFDFILSAKDADDKDVELDDKMSYKVGADYTLDALKFEGWYKAYIGYEVGGKATYTLADGVDASLKVTSGKADKDDKDSKLAYTALIKAAL